MPMRPILPPRFGYVEVIDETGSHVYKPTPETEARLQMEAALKEENKMLNAQVTALTDQNDFQEELIVELANIVYA